MKNNVPSTNVRKIRVGFGLLWVVVLTVVLLSAGCRQPTGGAQVGQSGTGLFGQSGPFAANSQQHSSFVGNQMVNGDQANQAYGALAGEAQRLKQSVGAFDLDNESLNIEVAALQRKLQLANQYGQTLKTQLADTSSRVQRSDMERQSALERLAATEAKYQQMAKNGLPNASGNSGQSAQRQVGFGGGAVPSQFAGGATIRANNSLRQLVSEIQIPGSQIRMDGDVIRIEIPTDRLFVPGTYQIQPAQLPLLQDISSTLRQSFGKKMIGIEAHWDNTLLNPPTTTHHQLTTTQALSVLDQMVRLGVPKGQLFTMAMAGNRPKYPQGVSNGVSPNRRIEFVIYPETVDGT